MVMNSIETIKFGAVISLTKSWRIYVYGICAPYEFDRQIYVENYAEIINYNVEI